MQENDDEDEDGHGKTRDGRWVAEGLPTYEEDDDADPQNRAEAAEDIEKDLLEVVLAMVSDDILPIPLESRGGSSRAETGPGVHVELLEESVGLQDVIVQAFEIVLIGLILLGLPCFDGRFCSVLGLGDLKRKGPELDRYPGGLVALGGIVRAPNGVPAQRTMPTKSGVVDPSTSLFRWYCTIELDAGCTTRSIIRGLVRVIKSQFKILF